MENEIWKDIPGYAGIYQVSNYGRVKSLPKSYIICNKYVVTAKEKVLKQPMNMNNPITKEKIRNIPRIKGKENPLFEGKSPDAKAVIQYDMKK